MIPNLMNTSLPSVKSEKRERLNMSCTYDCNLDRLLNIQRNNESHASGF
jgi:hypothetical protein